MGVLGEGKVFKDESPNTQDHVWWDQYYFGKFPIEAYNPDELVASKGAEVYRRMMLDEQVKASYEFIVSTIITRNSFFELTSDDPIQKEIKRFLEFNVDQTIESTFKQALKSILLSKAHGFSLSEKIFKVQNFEGKPSWVLRSIKPKYFDSFDLQRDEYGNLSQISQYQDGSRVVFNIDDFIYHVNFPEYEPVYGVSDLRAAYKAYWQKSVVEKLWAIYVERMAGGAIIASAQSDAPPLQASEKNDFKKMLKNLSQSPGIIVPKGYDLDMVFPNNTNTYQEFVAIKDRQIARSLLMPSLSGFVEQQNVGSQALAEVQERYFFDMVAAQAEQLAETLNEQLFLPIVKWNYGVEEFPRFKFDSLTEKQKSSLVEGWRNAVKDGVVVNTFADEARTRTLLSYPQREESEGEELNNSEEDSCCTSVFSSSDVIEVDFKKQKEILDSLESNFIKKLSSNLRSIIADVQKNTRDIYRSAKQIGSLNASRLNSINDFVSSEKLEKLNQDIRENLQKSYDKSRELASSEVKKVDPEASFIDRGILSFSDFTVAKFVEGLTLEKVEEILDLETFNITGILEQDILKVARQVLIDGVEQDKSIDAVIQDLREQLSALIGKPVIDQITGKVKFNIEDQSRLENIARTIINNIFNQGKLSIYTDPQLDGFVKAFEYSSILDSRTTEFCRKFDGFIRLVNDPIWRQITPPNHFQCRSTLIPLTEFDDFVVTKKLPKQNNKFVQPGKGFGIVSKKNNR